MNPSESVKIFLDTKSKKAIGIHFGTFANLTDEAIDDPPKDLKRALIENNIPQERFIVPEFGELIVFKKHVHAFKELANFRFILNVKVNDADNLSYQVCTPPPF